MTARVKRRVRDWAYPVLMAAMAVGIVVEAILLVPVMQNQAEQSKSGQQARMTQCQVRPVTIKKENWFHASGVTSEKERQLVLAALPSREECTALLQR